MEIRSFRPDDLDAIVGLSLRAWEPIYTTWRDILGPDIYRLAYPNWRRTQGESVRKVCAAASSTLVATDGQTVVGFAAVVVDDEGANRAGNLEMIATDPGAQRRGIGTALVEASLQVMRDAGCRYANVWTGGDGGHTPARALYAKNGFTPLPVVHYYKEL